MWTHEYINKLEIPKGLIQTLLIFQDDQQVMREIIKLETDDPAAWDQIAQDFINFLQNNS
jgi:hypothetical protein